MGRARAEGDAPKKGDVVTGLPAAGEDFRVFHSGTALKDGAIVTTGGHSSWNRTRYDQRFKQRHRQQLNEQLANRRPDAPAAAFAGFQHGAAKAQALFAGPREFHA